MSFDPLLNDDVGWSRIIQTAASDFSPHTDAANLILDLSHSKSAISTPLPQLPLLHPPNSLMFFRGESVCLAYWLMSFLVRPWQSAPFAGVDVLYSPWDFKKSMLTDTLVRYGIIGSSQYYSPNTGQTVTSSWYTPSQFYQRGGVSSAYTDKLYYAGCMDVMNRLPQPSNWFSKILIISDGRCSGACAQLCTPQKHLTHHNMVLCFFCSCLIGWPFGFYSDQIT